MQTHWFADGLALYNYDCREVLPVLGDASVDSVCTDPPYGLEFMGKDWDSFKPAKGKWGDREHSPTLIDADDTPHHRSAVHQPAVLSRCQRCGGNSSGQWNRCACASPDFRKPVWPMQAYQAWCTEWAAECFRVLKPGGYLVAFGGTRTYHRLASAIEDAGFEIRDSLHWLYGSGFPKSLNVARAIDKRMAPGELDPPVSPEGVPWSGFGTALKPAHEPIVLARKPLAGTVAQNVLQHGTGALNVDGCRVNPGSQVPGGGGWTGTGRHVGWQRESHLTGAPTETHSAGRWPPNVLLTHAADCDGQCAPDSGCPVAGLDGQSAPNMHGAGSARAAIRAADNTGMFPLPGDGQRYGDTGGASRFFPQLNWSPEYDLPFLYQAKASAKERPRHADGSAHPTVKPLALMRWLARLVTPPGGTILDPFCGTGTTLQAARLEGFRSIGCDSWDQAAEMACQRLGLVVEADAG